MHEEDARNDDEYPTCAKTYATLLIYPEEIDPPVVTHHLGIEPSHWQRKGEAIERDGRRLPRVAILNLWSLTSEGQIDSRDSRRHIDWLLDQLDPKAEAVGILQEMGCQMAIFCYWLSQSGQGGPTIPASQMKRLGELNIELWFDFYGPYDEDDI